MQPNVPAPLPIVRHLIACEDIQRGSPERFTLVNVITRIRSLDPVPFPLLYREICFIAICTACRGPARVQLRIVEEESGVPIYTGPVLPAASPERSSAGRRPPLPHSESDFPAGRLVSGAVVV